MELVKNIKSVYSIDYLDDFASVKISSAIKNLKSMYMYKHWIVMCIGTDRSTGDSLGPMIGSNLKLKKSSNYSVFGTLEEPIHATNLTESINYIKTLYPGSGIIAIDSSLGRIKSVGQIQIINGPLKPGAGVKKTLPEIGLFNITGIVNIGGFMEYFVLQNTRLSLIVKMSDIIARGIHLSLY